MTSPTDRPAATAKRIPTNELAVVSVVVAVFAILVAFIPFFGSYVAWVPAIAAILFAVIGLVTAHRFGGVRRAVAIIGLGLGLLAIIVSFWSPIAHALIAVTPDPFNR